LHSKTVILLHIDPAHWRFWYMLYFIRQAYLMLEKYPHLWRVYIYRLYRVIYMALEAAKLAIICYNFPYADIKLISRTSIPDKGSHFYFYDNFGKCGPISIIVSLLDLVMNCGRGTCKRFHLTSQLLPHYLVMCECSIWMSDYAPYRSCSV